MSERKDFETTSWSLVRAARHVDKLDELIARYWKPLYFVVRHRGFDSETAKDIVQEFFATFVERNSVARADPSRGRFRTFLLTALTNFIADWARTAARLKRGGGKTILSLDFEGGEREYAANLASGHPPDRIVERAWARSVLDQAIEGLDGDPAHLAAFRMLVNGEPYKTICARTGLGESAAKVAIHRLRDRLKEDILSRLRQTTASEDELQAEFAHFCELLSERE